MSHNPISDMIDFLLKPGWTTFFWALLLASIAMATYAVISIRDQRRTILIWHWAFRLAI